MRTRFGAGRKRKPAEQKVIEGRFRPDRDGVVHGSGKFPEPPARLSELERQLWAELPRPIWVTESDVLAVTAAVSLYAKILEVREKNAAKWRIGLVAQEGQLWGRLLAVLASLGMTPADRSKVAPTRPDVTASDDKWAGIL